MLTKLIKEYYLTASFRFKFGMVLSDFLSFCVSKDYVGGDKTQRLAIFYLFILKHFASMLSTIWQSKVLYQLF